MTIAAYAGEERELTRRKQELENAKKALSKGIGKLLSVKKSANMFSDTSLHKFSQVFTNLDSFISQLNLLLSATLLKS